MGVSARDGRSQLGREIPLHVVGDICSALGLDARPDFAPESLVAAVLASGRAMPVKAREPLMLKCSLFNSAQRLERLPGPAFALNCKATATPFSEQSRKRLPISHKNDNRCYLK